MKYAVICWVAGSILLSAAVIADTETKLATSSSAKSSVGNRPQPIITNEAEYAEFVRKREGGQANSVAATSSSSKPANKSSR